jgi:hypothetical protein
MTTVTLSLWLPISRSNFYSPSSGHEWLESYQENGQTWWRSKRLDDPEYAKTPLVLVHVLRRIIEVLPVSFGYNPLAALAFRGDSESRRRPVHATMFLDLSAGKGLNDASQQRANLALSRAGATSVRVAVNENGYYTFTATADETADPKLVREALSVHIQQVFGGDYEVHSVARDRRDDQGSASLKKYNGIEEVKGGDARDVRVGPPRGILSFYQLNILAEGIWNDQLMPAVYLEQHDLVQQFLAERRRESSEFHRGMQGVIRSITTDVDATSTLGQILVLHHFLTVTAQTSLRKLGLALESVRRRLLDEMMGALHRHSRLAQLNLSTSRREWVPELAVGASETQLKGYSALVSAKLPLIVSIREAIRLAKENLDWQVESGTKESRWSPEDARTHEFELTRLDGQLQHWVSLLDDLNENVRSLERTIEHAWMDQVLYENQQTRSNQEAMAEIERSRQGRPTVVSTGTAAYNVATLLLGAAAVVLTVNVSDFDLLLAPGTAWWRIAVALWPVWLVIILVLGVFPLAERLYRAARTRRGLLHTYPYEFAFRLNAAVDLSKLKEFDKQRSRRRVPADGIRKLHITNRGYGRIEQVSPDSTTIKAHSVGSFKIRRSRYAHFEVINEIQAHRVGAHDHHTLVQCRVFGESSRPLSTEVTRALLTAILVDITTNIAAEDPVEVGQLVARALP